MTGTTQPVVVAVCRDHDHRFSKPAVTEITLLALPRGTVLRLGPEAVVEITGLRNPCRQINEFRPGMLKAVLGADAAGNPIRKAGIMGIVRHGGPVQPGDAIGVDLPDQPHVPLDLV